MATWPIIPSSRGFVVVIMAEAPSPSPTPPPTAQPTASKPTTPRARGDSRSESGGSDGGRPRGPIARRYFRPSLVDLCVPVMAANFLRFPTFGNIPLDLRTRVVALLPLDLPLDLSANLIYEDDYWERRSRLHWSNSDIAAHGRSWKQLFFERYLADALESFDPTCAEESSLTDLLQLCAQYIHNLTLYQLPSRMSVSVFFNYIASELEALKLEYGCRNAGMSYDKYNYGMKISDCRSLSAAIRVSSALTELNLSYNSLDDRKVGILVEGMLLNSTVVHLDLSDNDISNAGVAEIIKLLSTDRTILTVLNLCNNLISADGAIKLSEVLKTNAVLLSLNLRHNLICDDGGQAIFEALYSNSALERLSVGSCRLGELSVAALSRLLHNPKSGLTGLDISSNRAIGESGGASILTALEAGKVMKEMNIEFCGIAEEVEVAISKLLAAKCVPDAKQYAYD